MLVTQAFLTEQKLNENQENPIDNLNILESNINFLKDGGVQDFIRIPPLPEKFEKNWFDLKEKFLDFKQEIFTCIEMKNNHGSVSIDHQILFFTKYNKLIQSADVLTSELGLDLENSSKNLLIFQGVLGGINIGAHIFLIILILKILRKEYENREKSEKLATIGELAARMAHDFRNPLGIIKTALAMLKPDVEQKLNSNRKLQLEIANKAISRMSHQINDVMDFVRITQLNLKQYSSMELINQVIGKLSIPNSVNIQLPKDDFIIYCDKVKLEIVLVNLIINALDAINNIGSIFIRVFEKEDYTLIEIEDSGEGISKKNLSKIFEPLFTTKERGTGLGLASCKSIIEQHRGTISVKQNPTVFSILLPKKK